MSKKRIQPGEKVSLQLTAAERRLVLEELTCLDLNYERIILGTLTGKPVKMTLDDLDDFGGYVAAEANHCDDKKKERKLDRVFRKIQDLLDKYTDEDDNTISIEQARRKMVKPMRDLTAGKKPEVVSYRLPSPPRKLQTAKFPIKITALQREALISCTRLKASIKRKLKEAEDGTQPFEFTSKELEHLQEELGQAAMSASSPYKSRVVAVRKKVDVILNEAQLVGSGSKQPAQQRRPATKSQLLFQFKITLLDIKPSIWRRIQVRDSTLADLHDHIQAAFGWWNYHLHQFEIEELRYGPLSPDGDDFGLEMEDESGVSLSRILPKGASRTRWTYEYDFGDGWRHEVLFEGHPPVDKKTKYPVCLEGERACPPEDVGGVWGFSEYLEALADHDHERHQEFMEWRGPFDSEVFDAEKATREMRKK